MAIIPGVQICTSQHGQRAENVIQRMEDLLALRYRHQVSRRAFIARWDKLRLALRLTREYSELQAQVCREAKGMCEYCGHRAGEHMHHEVPVAFAPRRALDRKNVKFACVACHEDQDAIARERVLGRTHHSPVSGIRTSGHRTTKAERILQSGDPDR